MRNQLEPIGAHLRPPTIRPSDLSILTYGLAVAVLVVGWAWWVKQSRARSYSFYRLQGPAGAHFLLGNIGQMVGIGVGQSALSWLDRYGPTLRPSMAFSQSALFTVDKAALSFILRSTDIFPKQKPLRRQLARYLDNGIVVAEGDVHRRQKKMLAPSFAPGMIKAYNGLFLDQSARLRDKWLGLVDDFDKPACMVPGPRTDGRKIDVLKYVMDWSMDVIGQAGFAHDMGGLAEKRDELAIAFEASVRNFGRISPVWVLQSMVPFFDYIPNPVTWQMNANKAATRRLSKQIFLEKRREVLEDRKSDSETWGKDILSNLLRANMSPAVSAQDKLPDDEVIAQIGTLLLAGKANTAFAATWCLYELAQNPTVQDRLRRELESVLSREPDGDILASLPYLGAVLRESLRLHPSVPQTMRVATRDVVVPLDKPVLGTDGKMMGSVEVPKGTTIIIPIVYANTNAELWGPTAHLFDPDRFLTDISPEGSAGMWGKLLTFIDGPRGCIGYRFALAEIRALISILIRSFTFEPVPGEEIISWHAIKNQPVVRGQEELGMQLPLIVKPLH